MLGDASNRHTLRWAEYFKIKGHQVHLASLESPAPTEAEISLLKTPIMPRPFRYLSAVPAVRRLADDIKPDLVNAHFLPNYGWLAALAGLDPLILSVWGSDVLVSAQKSPLHRARARYVLARSRLVTCDGQNLVRALQDLGAASQGIVNIPMGVEEDILKTRFQGWNQAGPVKIASVRQLEPVYNVEVLIRAASRMSSERVSFHIDVAGWGSKAGQLKKLAEKSGLTQALHFRGSLPHPELVTLLQQADIYVATSLSDSTSVSLLEAMACGCIPVVTDIPGNREWIEHGRNGYLFPAGDYLALAGILKQLINDPPDVPGISRANAEIIRNRALWKHNMVLVERTFLDIIKGKQETSIIRK